MAGRAKAVTEGTKKTAAAKTASTKTAARGVAKSNTAEKKAAKAPVQEEYLITELDQYLFGQGTHYDIFRKLGAHPMTWKGKKGTAFAVWAPNAKSVHVIGTFNGWDEDISRNGHAESRLVSMKLFVSGDRRGRAV